MSCQKRVELLLWVKILAKKAIMIDLRVDVAKCVLNPFPDVATEQMLLGLRRFRSHCCDELNKCRTLFTIKDVRTS